MARCFSRHRAQARELDRKSWIVSIPIFDCIRPTTSFHCTSNDFVRSIAGCRQYRDQGYLMSENAIIASGCSANATHRLASDLFGYRRGRSASKLREGYDLVMGNRFKGGIEPGAMPALHRWLDNPLLSFIGRIFFNAELGDFHCGLRGFNTSVIRDLKLRSRGMEFASEIVVRCRLARMRTRKCRPL